VPAEKPSPEAELDEIKEGLSSGIETCRFVIANYKSLLTPDELASPSEESQVTAGSSDD